MSDSGAVGPLGHQPLHNPTQQPTTTSTEMLMNTGETPQSLSIQGLVYFLQGGGHRFESCSAHNDSETSGPGVDDRSPRWGLASIVLESLCGVGANLSS